MKAEQSGHTLVTSTKSITTGINGILKCPLGTSQSEAVLEIDEKKSKLPEITGKISTLSNQIDWLRVLGCSLSPSDTEGSPLSSGSERQSIPSSVLVEDLPSREQDLLISGKHLVKSLICKDLDLSLLDLSPGLLHKEDSPSLTPPMEEPQPIYQPSPGSQSLSTQCTPWLLEGMALMRFNS
ncbi:hypothetical protein DSO57_1037127 [Entomophthora muscae]|uniref:Uncharacterized protein n=1 Tax=Entomophthora muscae TaxID=34485 RepID=A0ACC2RDQ2_9FUNG|nr:hypothetical protein DSO57_1037127 [Entomophthora muscae]